METKAIKTTIYFPQKMAEELVAESKRIGHPVGYLLRIAWLHSREQVKALPGDLVTMSPTPASIR